MNPREYLIMSRLEENHWWYRGLHDLVLRVISAEHDRKGELSILDAGCGTGRLCRLLAPFGTVRGCDLSELALQLCRERGGVDVFQADLNSADLGCDRYDVITCLDVLYHQAVEREGQVLDSLYRALRPGGLLLLNLVAFESLRSHHDLAVHTRRRYRRHEVIHLLRQAGFSIRLCSYRLCLLFPLIAVYRRLQRLISPPADPSAVPSDLRLPGALVNCLLELALRLENRLMAHLPLPFGLSVFAVAQKGEDHGSEGVSA